MVNEEKLLEIRNEIDDFVRCVIEDKFLIAFHKMLSPALRDEYFDLKKRHDDFLDETNDCIHARSEDFFRATILHYMREGWK